MDRLKLVEKSIITPQGEIFYYLDRSFPGKRTVMFLHGLSSNHTTWTNIIQKIHAAGFNSLAVDLRGHGKSDKRKRRSNYNIPVFSADLLQILQREEISQVVLVGYSFGGTVALDFISRHPDRVGGLVLISTNSVCAFKYKHIMFLKPAGWSFVSLLALLFLWQGRKKYIYFQHGASAGYWHSVWIGLNTMPLSVNLWMFAAGGVADFRKILPQIKVPTIIVRASHDPYLTDREARDMQQAISGAKLIISESASHFLATHAQDEMAQIILDLLQTL